MIISASYKTDIPAFYGDWFLNRLDAGYCMVRNPYGGKSFPVSLQRPDVDGFVFWTRNVAPFIGRLAIVHERGYPFVVQYTIIRYPQSLDPSVPPAGASVENMHRLAALYGPLAAVWRYDTIIFTQQTPWEFHVENFRSLAKVLRGATNEVVISFFQDYKKAVRNLRLARIPWTDPDDSQKVQMVKELASLAKQNGMQLTICAQASLVAEGAREARCVDADRLSAISGKPLCADLKGNRGCACYYSKDIGDYDTCLQGCKYCYATNNKSAAIGRYRAHDPSGEMLIPRKKS